MKSCRAPLIEDRPDTLEGGWESFTVTIDAPVKSQDYIEDFEACCHPICFIAQLDDRDDPITPTKQQDGP